MLISFLKGTKLLSYRAYVLIMALSWIYSSIWAAGLVATWIYWDDLGIYSRIGICGALIILTPAGSDLIQTYQKYKAQWEQSNRQAQQQ